MTVDVGNSWREVYRRMGVDPDGHDVPHTTACVSADVPGHPAKPPIFQGGTDLPRNGKPQDSENRSGVSGVSWGGSAKGGRKSTPPFPRARARLGTEIAPGTPGTMGCGVND